MRKWTKGTREYASPPILRPDQSLAISHQDKCDAKPDRMVQWFAPPFAGIEPPALGHWFKSHCVWLISSWPLEVHHPAG